MLRGDSLRISQALVNLLANAVKHGGRSRVRLSATVDKLSLEGGTHLLTLRVEDDGPGVPERDRERIFEPYVQLGESRHQTTGLGLTLSRKLARQMGGNLTVATSELGGARFDLSVKVSGPPFQ
jgi:signal transduction histidine kinase